jgi:opacity protein-like surface antigen
MRPSSDGSLLPTARTFAVTLRWLAATLAAVPVGTAALPAQQWAAGARHHVAWGGPSTRAGDIQGYGVSLRRSLGAAARSPWELELSVDRLEYDLETPVHAVGVEPRATDLPVDAYTTITRGMVEVVRRFHTDARIVPFVSAGGGVWAIDVPDVSGNVEGGGTFRLRIESPTTVGLTAGAGGEWRIIERLVLRMALSFAQTTTRYRVTDVESGAVGRISPHASLGLGTQLALRW